MYKVKNSLNMTHLSMQPTAIPREGTSNKVAKLAEIPTIFCWSRFCWKKKIKEKKMNTDWYIQRNTCIFFWLILFSEFLHVEPLYNSVSTYNPITGQMYAGFEDAQDENPFKGKRAQQTSMGNGGQTSIIDLTQCGLLSIVAPL